MKTAWTKGLTGSAREEMERGFLASFHTRERLALILKEKIDSRRIKRVSEELYASPSWAYVQADAVGYERAMQEVISLLQGSSVKDVKELG